MDAKLAGFRSPFLTGASASGLRAPGFVGIRRRRNTAALPMAAAAKPPSGAGAPSTPAFSNRDASIGVKNSSEQVAVGEDSQLIREYEASDFTILPQVSVGLFGRSDEAVFEGIVSKANSPMRGMRVVLRQLEGPRAQKWGKRAMAVTPRLIRGMGNYHAYSIRLHGFISNPACGKGGSSSCLTLVHGYYGSYSLHHWLLHPDWLPQLEVRLALHREAKHRVGDQATGGSVASRHHRVLRMLLRDILIGVNNLHSRGMAHLDLRLQNVHISAADRHVKVGLLGSTVDFPAAPAGKPSSRQHMISFDIRCIGVMMARMVFKELVDPTAFELFQSFLKEGHDPAGLREFMRATIFQNDPSDNVGLQVLDRDQGAGWHLLSSMLSTQPSDRVSCVYALRHPFLCSPSWRVEPTPGMLAWTVGSAAIRITEEYLYLPYQRQRLEQLIGILERMSPGLSDEDWLGKAPGKWRLLYHTGLQIGLTLRQAATAVRVGRLTQTLTSCSALGMDGKLSLAVDIPFTMMSEGGKDWPHDKAGVRGILRVTCSHVLVTPGLQLVNRRPPSDKNPLRNRWLERRRFPRGWLVPTLDGRGGFGNLPPLDDGDGFAHKSREEADAHKEVTVLGVNPVDVQMAAELDYYGSDPEVGMSVLNELRLQVPQEMFDVAALGCVTYLDGRLLIMRGVSGAALLFVRCPQ